MRTERNKDGSWNVWMSREEYWTLPRAAESFEREVAMRHSPRNARLRGRGVHRPITELLGLSDQIRMR